MTDAEAVPRARYAEKAAAFLDVHRAAASTHFITNLDTRVDALTSGGLTIPVTVNDGSESPGNAWVCSPTTTYGRYALEESERHLPQPLRPPLRLVIGAADRGMRWARMDRAVTVGNWLLSTNLHPAVAGIDLRALVRDSRERWPRHAIWIRSLNTVQHADWLRAAASAGFTLIPSRQVYLFRDADPVRAHRDLRRDFRLLDRTDLAFVAHEDFTAADFVQAERLYAQLYLEKYSTLNPHYTAAFLRSWHEAGLLECAGFRDDMGVLRAMVGMFGIGSGLTAPIVGYDTSWSQSVGLYRRVIAHVLRTARRRGADLNLSAGAAEFKRIRGGRPAIEYSAVHVGDLGASARMLIATLRTLTTRVGVPIMQRYQL